MKNRLFLINALAAAALMSSAAIIPAAADEMQTAADSTVLHEGAWTKKSFAAAGTWSIYQEGGKTFLKLSDDFSTRNAPDLKLFLSPLAAAETNGKNATNGSVLIAPLASNKGGQVYEIPAGTDLASFKSLLIHCEQYSKLWAATGL